MGKEGRCVCVLVYCHQMKLNNYCIVEYSLLIDKRLSDSQKRWGVTQKPGMGGIPAPCMPRKESSPAYKVFWPPSLPWFSDFIGNHPPKDGSLLILFLLAFFFLLHEHKCYIFLVKVIQNKKGLKWKSTKSEIFATKKFFALRSPYTNFFFKNRQALPLAWAKVLQRT